MKPMSGGGVKTLTKTTENVLSGRVMGTNKYSFILFHGKFDIFFRSYSKKVFFYREY